jgi:inorganic pyrophosphatase
MPNLTIGKDAPSKVNCLIEIPKGSNVKYEYDEHSGSIKVDRILHTSMVYPYNYGFVCGTLGEDGDPLDIMVISGASFFPGTTVVVRPIGLLLMKDEEGIDTKILGVGTDKIDPEFKLVNDVKELPENVKDRIAHFFKYYKSIEPGKWSEVSGWENASRAREVIDSAVKRVHSKGGHE